MIYFITQGDEYVKIGYGVDPEARLSQLQVGNPERLKLLACFSGGQQEELCLHDFLKALRIRGEWFEFNEEVRRFIHVLVDSDDLAAAFHNWRKECEEAEVIPFPVTSA